MIQIFYSRIYALLLLVPLVILAFDSDVDTVMPISNTVLLLYSDDFQSKLLNIDEQVILKALSEFDRDPNSYTYLTGPSNFCVYSNNKKGGLRFMVSPRAFGSYSAKNSGANQDPSGGSLLRFYNSSLNISLPYFLIVQPNQAATDPGLLGERQAFTVGASQKPMGSRLAHLQAGVWEKIDHFDVTSNKSSNGRMGGSCPGVPITMSMAVLNKDLIGVSSGSYATGFSVNVEAID